MAKKIYDVVDGKTIDKTPILDLAKLKEQLGSTPFSVINGRYIEIDTTDTDAALKAKIDQAIK